MINAVLKMKDVCKDSLTSVMNLIKYNIEELFAMGFSHGNRKKV